MEKYTLLCAKISESKYKTFTLKQIITEKQNVEEPYIILRHDVDRSPKNALQMADIESKFGISSTYYFRTINSKLFDTNRILEIKDLGHEIGYHYEVLSESKGDIIKAKNLFQNSIDMFHSIGIKVETASFHGSPLSKFHSRDIWKTYHFSDFGLKGLAYESIDFSNLYYLTDTGRTFLNINSNIRDYPLSSTLKDKDFRSTKDIIEFLSSGRNNLYITTHPVRWATSRLNWIWELCFQSTKNIFKSILINIR